MADESESKVLVIGAGLAGCLTSLLLAKSGCNVELYEYREEKALSGTADTTYQQRSINLAISTRGLTALDLVGLADKVRSTGVPMHGRAVHSQQGNVDYQRYGVTGQFLLSISRSLLNTLLIEECNKEKNITIFFGHKCVDVDIDAGCGTFATGSGVVKATGAVVIGADGTWSRVRAAFMRRRDFNFSQDYISAAYKEITLDPKDGRMNPNWLHIWPRHRFMLIALPNDVKSYTCTLFMDRAKFNELRNGDGGEAVRFFEQHFPDALQHMPNLKDEFIKTPTPPLVTVRCSPYHAGKCLLVGDAAHSMVPFYGQGSQCAFEDCRILATLYKQYKDWNLVLPKFTEERKENADTIANLSLDNYTDMASRSATPTIVAKRRLGVLLNRLFPAWWMPLYTMVSFSNIPYAEAVKRVQQREAFLNNVLRLGAIAGASVAIVIGARWKRASGGGGGGGGGGGK